VDRGKQGLKRSLATAGGIPLAAVPAPANRDDSPLLAPTLDKTLATLDTLGPRPAQPTVHLDAAYDSDTTRTTLANRDLQGQIARKGVPAPIQATPALAGGAHLCLGQPVQQAALVHRAQPPGRGVLAGAGPRDHHLGPADSPGLDLLPVGRPSPPPAMRTPLLAQPLSRLRQ
jgi:hypothetical protein